LKRPVKTRKTTISGKGNSGKRVNDLRPLHGLVKNGKKERKIGEHARGREVSKRQGMLLGEDEEKRGMRILPVKLKKSNSVKEKNRLLSIKKLKEKPAEGGIGGRKEIGRKV